MAASIYALKPRFQALLRPLVARLAALGVTANQVTLLALAISRAIGAFVAISAATPGHSCCCRRGSCCEWR